MLEVDVNDTVDEATVTYDASVATVDDLAEAVAAVDYEADSITLVEEE